MVARTSLFLRYLYIIRRKNVIDCRHVETLPPDCHSLRPRPPPFSPPQTRFPGKRYHEQTASPNKAQSSWRSKSHEQKRRHAHEGHTVFLELLMGFGSRLRARSSAALTGLAAARSRSGSDSPPDCHSLPSRRFATTGLSFTPPATASLFTTANAFPRETLPRTNGIPEQSAKFVALQIPLAKNSRIHKGCESFLELLMGFGPMTSSLPMTCSTD